MWNLMVHYLQFVTGMTINITRVMIIMVIPKMVKVNLDIEESLHKTIRKEAIDRGITMKAYLLELIEEGVKAKEEKATEE
jgi:predicted DNA binding CopG/RHH family protein